MRLPAQLYRPKKNSYKNQFGHVLVLAGSNRMLGAAALTALAAMRSGAGLVTVGVPRSLNLTLQKKLKSSIMTLPLRESKTGSISVKAWDHIKNDSSGYSSIALGPGLSRAPSTVKFAHTVIKHCAVPLVIDADALNALQNKSELLRESKTDKILTPHIGEMARLTGLSKKYIQENRERVIRDFSNKHHCVMLLKGNQTLVYQKGKPLYKNASGNAGLAKAGSGDVLTGIIAGFLAQGLKPYDAAKYGAYVHGKAGDLAAKKYSKTAMMAGDIIDHIGLVFLKGA